MTTAPAISPAHSRYTSVAISLHWLIAVLAIGQIAGGFYFEGLPKSADAERFQLIQLHKSFGITILLLTFARLAWRLGHKPPPLPKAMPGWQKAAARGLHIGFYVLLIGVPLGGWAIVSASPLAETVKTYLFGVVPWPHLPFFDGIEDRKGLAHDIAELHEIGAKLMLGMIVLHAGAAMKHWLLDRDGVLESMAPFLARK
ncbi:MAG TPA: cytochrome B [Parvularcula sp.]|nr:cytochrome B [Parvularcula sp.]